MVGAQNGRVAGQSSPEARRIAVNVDVRESLLERLSEEEFLELVGRPRPSSDLGVRAEAFRQEGRLQLWRLLLGLMVIGLLLESALGRRLD
jgi:hypothetical protein